METVSNVMDMVLRFCNIVLIAYGLYKWLGKPHSELERRVTALEKDNADLRASLEKEKTEIRASLSKGNKRFDHIVKGLEIIMRSMMALIEFEQSYCMTEHKEFSEGLKESKKELNRYLSTIGKGFEE